MDEQVPDAGRISTTPELADGSALSESLTELGEQGIRALDLLRSADRLLNDEQEWARRSEIVISCCRSAVEGLLELAGKRSSFVGTGSTGRALSDELAKLLKARKPGGPLEKLEAELDALDVFPDALNPQNAVFARLQSLVNARSKYKAPLENPSAVFEARVALVAAVDALTSLPDRLSESDPVVVALRALFDSRKTHTAFLRDDLAPRLKAVEDAYAAFKDEQANEWRFRTRQVTKLVTDQTRREPGAGELQAIKAWADFYKDANPVVHGKSTTDEQAAGVLRKVVDAIVQLFGGLPERAPRLRELVELQYPTQAEAAEVSRFTDPRSSTYFFKNATSAAWLSLLPDNRLLPENDRWTAAAYFERLAVEESEAVLSWLTARLPTITETGPEAAGRTLRIARVLGTAASGFVLKLVKAGMTDALLLDIYYWAIDVPVEERSGHWVSIMTTVLNALAAADRQYAWETQQGLEHLRMAGTAPEDSGPGSSLAAQVRQGLAAVLAAGLASPDADRDIEYENDLRSVGDMLPGDSVVRMAARACLDFARDEAERGIAVTVRCSQWFDRLPAGPTLDRLVAVHLLETPPAQDANDWWDAALDVTSRLGTVRRVTADLSDFVRTMLDSCADERRLKVETALADAVGAPPDAAGLEAGRQALAERALRSEVRIWILVRALSPVLPASIVEPWRPVLDIITELFGSPPERPEPIFKVVATREPESGFAALSAAAGSDGAIAVARLLTAPTEPAGPVPKWDRGTLLANLVAENPATWMADPETVTNELGDLDLQTAYLAALRSHIVTSRVTDHDVIRQTALPMWGLIRAATSSEADAGAIEELERNFCLLLQAAWPLDVDLGEVAPDIVRWLDDAVTSWTTPTRSQADPVRVMSAEVGGLALVALILWGCHRARADGAAPTAMTDRVDAVLAAAPDDRALAAIGWTLTQLHRHTHDWFTAHQAELIGLGETWRPARIWLKHLTVNTGVFAHLDPHQLQSLLCSPDTDQETRQCAHAFLVEPDVLGPIEDFLAALVVHEGGRAAVSRLLSRVAWRLPRDGSGEDLHETALRIWHTVLDLDVPDEFTHLHGAGAFAFAAGVDDDTWLELTRRTTELTPLVEAPDHVARRAAKHPQSVDTRAILTSLLPLCDGAVASDLHACRRAEIDRQAYSVWQACSVGDAGRRELGRALADHAGRVECLLDE